MHVQLPSSTLLCSKQIFMPMQSLLITDKMGEAMELPLQSQQLEQSPSKALMQRYGQVDRAQQPCCVTHRHFGVQEPFVGFVLRSRALYEDWNSVHLFPSKLSASFNRSGRAIF